MIPTLKFVRGAVASKSLVPEMKHFSIKDGRIRSFNGTLALSGLIDFDIDCAPLAVPMINAIGNCGEVVSLGMTPAGRLRIQSGKFKAFIECVDLEGLPHQDPEGEEICFDGEQMMLAIKNLISFVGDDASRPWTNGILLRGSSAFATNNVCLVEYWIGTPIPFTVNIPIHAIKEMVRINEAPTHAQVCDHSVTFHYSDGRWIRTQLYDTEWPDLTKILDVECKPEPVSEDLFEGLRIVKPFLDEHHRIYFDEGQIRTSTEEGLGATYTVEGLHSAGIYSHKMITLLEGLARYADFKRYPEPVIFYGERLRGAMMGLRA